MWKLSDGIVTAIASTGLLLLAMAAWTWFISVHLFGNLKDYEFEMRFLWLCLTTIQFGMVLGMGVAGGGIAIGLRGKANGSLREKVVSGVVAGVVVLAGVGFAWACLTRTEYMVDAVHMSLALTEPVRQHPAGVTEAPQAPVEAPVMVPMPPAP
jgi:hypothetical protein